VLEALTRLWLRPLPRHADEDRTDDMGDLPYQVIRKLYEVFAESARSVYEVPSVHEVGQWAGYMNFKQDEHWHFRIAIAYSPEIECSMKHMHEAVNACDGGFMKGWILTRWSDLISNALTETGVGFFQPLAFTHEHWQLFDNYLRSVDENPELMEEFYTDRQQGDTSNIYFRRFLFYGLLDDIDKAIAIHEKQSSHDVLGIFLQAHWIQTRSDADFKRSADKLEETVSHFQEWYHLKMPEWFSELVAELYRGEQNNTAIETYIGELERLGYSSSLSLFLRQVLSDCLYDSETEDSESDNDTLSIEILGGESSEIDMVEGEDS
jgi:hypothetical protein